MVKIQVNSLGKAYYTSGGKVLLSAGGGGDTIQAINNTGAVISADDKVYIAPLTTPQSGANYEIVPVKTTDSLGLGVYTIGENSYPIPEINLTDKSATNFSRYSYLQVPKVFDYTQPWEFNICLETGSNIYTEEMLFCGSLPAYHDGAILMYVYQNQLYGEMSYNNGGTLDGLYSFTNIIPSLATNTKYYVKIGWTGTEYYAKYSLNGTTWLENESRYSSQTQVYSNSPAARLGSRMNNDFPFYGKIYLDKTYFISNGELVWQAMYDGTWTNIGDDVVTGVANESIASGSVGEVTTLLGE